MQLCICVCHVDSQMCIADCGDDGDGPADYDEGEAGEHNGWGETASSPQGSMQTQQGGSALQTSDHSQVA